jgi:polyhydroxyalkanoate synthesis repressor PhaR
MPLIKRYPNRKLYDTEAKRYVSLEGVAELIRKGADVRVMDYASGEDITHVVLVQIIAEQERKQGGAMPIALLAGLIQTGEQTMAALRRGLEGPLEFLRQVDEEIERRVERLIDRGELEQEEGRALVLRLEAARDESDVAPAPPDLRALGIPTHDDIRRLAARLDALTAQLDGLTREEGLSGGESALRGESPGGVSTPDRQRSGYEMEGP